jgi:membrane-bound metal-dependent hydrolase YbcI (DUF457 family)
VDPVSHLLFARMVAALRTSRHVPGGVVAATVLGGLAPDVDAMLMAVGWDVYLRWHEVGTHSLAGTPLVAMAAGAFVRTWASSTALGPLVFGAWLGVLSHVFFDLYSGATIGLLWPLTSRTISAPVVAMADPIVIAVLVIGALAHWVWPRVPRTAAALVMALLALVSAAKLTTRAWASAAYLQAADAAGPVTQRVALEAVWGSWTAWHVFDRLDDGRVRAWRADGWSGEARVRFEQPTLLEASFARHALDDFATARNFVPVHGFAFATQRDNGNGRVVFWSDARFCWTPREATDAQDDVPHQDVRPAKGPVRCALWFGGSYDASGRPYEALVWLGGHLQRRSPQRWAMR